MFNCPICKDLKKSFERTSLLESVFILQLPVMRKTSSKRIALSCRFVWHFSRGHNWTQNIWMNVLVCRTTHWHPLPFNWISCFPFLLDSRNFAAVAHTIFLAAELSSRQCDWNTKQIKLARKLTGQPVSFMFNCIYPTNILSMSSVDWFDWVTFGWWFEYWCA